MNFANVSRETLERRNNKMRITSLENKEIYYFFNNEEVEKITVCKVADYYNNFMDYDYEYYKIEPNTPLILLKIKDIDTQVPFFGNWKITY